MVLSQSRLSQRNRRPFGTLNCKGSTAGIGRTIDPWRELVIVTYDNGGKRGIVEDAVDGVLFIIRIMSTRWAARLHDPTRTSLPTRVAHQAQQSIRITVECRPGTVTQ